MILVTGSTGFIGSEVVRLLSQVDVPARALARNPDKGQKLPGITWVAGDLAKPETLPAVFENCTKLFLLTGNVENAVELQHNAIVAARQAGVEHVVKLSAFGASPHSNSLIGRWHYQIEKELQKSGLAWTMLRPHHFMQNLLAQAENIIKNGVIYSAAGEGKIPFIDTRDIAAVAAVTLTQPEHIGKKYVITGSEAISYRQVTEIIGAEIGRELRYIDESFDEARARLTKAGQPSWLIESSLALAAYQRAGGPTETITSVVADLTGKPPRTFAEFAHDHAAVFRG
ncbi:MAG: NAD(P)H azoreductase [bacterium]|nr:NAD(P)H azoreductase [bacterium]